jgi:hypothetical protein
MEKLSIIAVFLITIVFCSKETFAQCSDAGICQLGGHSIEDEVLFTISGSYKYGYSGKEDNVQFSTIQLNGNYNLFSKTSVQILIPYNFQSGPAGSVNGIGDLIFSLGQNLLTDGKSSLNGSIGIKLATGDDNKDNLPQIYQSGLGTTDVLFGLSYTYDKITFGAGYQLSGGRNNNITRLEKGDDLLLRASYDLSFDKFKIIPQLLFIQRLTKSSILNTASTEEKFIEVANSNQSQLNFLAMLDYRIDGSISLIGDFAVPFLKREVNVDGLTRAFSASVGVLFSFN